MPVYIVKVLIEYEVEAENGGDASLTIRNQLKKDVIGIKTVEITEKNYAARLKFEEDYATKLKHEKEE
jgi:hypothetical protein